MSTSGRGMGAILGLVFALNLMIVTGISEFTQSTEFLLDLMGVLAIVVFETAFALGIILAIAWGTDRLFKSYTSGFYWSFVAILILEIILTIMRQPQLLYGQVTEPHVSINTITIDSQDRYVVEYKTLDFTDISSSQHIHFFFNSVSPETAGSKGIGDSIGGGKWYDYEGTSPFMGYKVSDRPKDATQMCALVSYQDHSIMLKSGNCRDLPE
jgi:hypothetical protein